MAFRFTLGRNINSVWHGFWKYDYSGDEVDPSDGGYILQEDDVFHFLLEDGSGAYIFEEQLFYMLMEDDSSSFLMEDDSTKLVFG